MKNEIKHNLKSMSFPTEYIKKWEKTINLIGSIFDVPLVFLSKFNDKSINVIVKSDRNSFLNNDEILLQPGFYCESVISSQKMLYVENAVLDKKWAKHIALNNNFIFYLGIPIKKPDNNIFGTICILDIKGRKFSKEYLELFEVFKDSIENDLITIFQNRELKQEIEERKHIERELQEAKSQLVYKLSEGEKEMIHVNADLKTEIYSRKKIENALRKEKQRAESYLQLAGVLILALDINGIVTMINPRGCELLECTEEDVVGKNWFSEFLHVNDLDMVMKVYQKIMSGDMEDVKYNENSIVTSKGNEKIIAWNNSLIKDRTGKITGVLCSGEDLTREKAINQSLKETRDQLELITDKTPAMLAYINSDLKYLYANEEYANTYSLNKETIIGKTVKEVLPFTIYKNAIKHMEDVLDGKEVAYENIGFKKNEEIYPVHVAYVPGYDEYGNVKSFLAMIEDISERKESERILKDALMEKETLLRELYHRTKNNMQVISAMLQLRAISTDNEQLTEGFMEMERRIQSMALVHEKLYQSQNLSSISVKEYFEDLVNLLISSYRVEEKEIDVKYNIDDVKILIDLAVPCGLILNELISNAFKHAFPGSRKGEIEIIFKKNRGDKDIIFEYIDNGVGFPDGFDIDKSDSLGLGAIYAMGEHQLQGSVDIAGENGVHCKIKFKDLIYDKRVEQ